MFAFLKKLGFTDKNKPHRQTSEADNSSGGLGVRGENLAVKFLRKSGYKILAKNYRCPTGEADIIALDKSAEAIVFVEVKSRSNNKYVNPESAVNSDKMRRLRNIARYYLTRHNTQELGIRFDVISVVILPGSKPQISHIVEAFS